MVPLHFKFFASFFRVDGYFGPSNLHDEKDLAWVSRMQKVYLIFIVMHVTHVKCALNTLPFQHMSGAGGPREMGCPSQQELPPDGHVQRVIVPHWEEFVPSLRNRMGQNFWLRRLEENNWLKTGLKLFISVTGKIYNIKFHFKKSCFFTFSTEKYITVSH